MRPHARTPAGRARAAWPRLAVGLRPRLAAWPRVAALAAAAPVLVLVLAAAVFAAPAVARPFTLEYRWGDTSWGNQPWFEAHYEDFANPVPTPQPSGPWYAMSFTPGDGLRIVPTGNGGAPYDRVRAIWFLAAPGESRINRVVYDDVRAQVEERQAVRVAIQSFAGPPAGPGAQRDYFVDGTTVNEDVTLTSSPGLGAGLASIWMYTTPCSGPCQPVDPSQGSFIAVRGATITFDDPTPPVVTLDAGGADQGWTNRRRATLAVGVIDPESGVAEVTARAPRSIRFARIRDDRRNVTPRDRLAPNRPPTATLSRTISLPRSGTVRVSVRAENGARMRATAATTIRVDRDRPRGLRATARDGRLALEASDSRSGVAELAAVVDGVRIVGAQCAADTCPRRAQASNLALPARRSIAVRVSATDRAGNTATIRRTVRGPRQSTVARVPAACVGRAYTRFLFARAGRAVRGDQTAEVLLGDRRADALDAAGGDDCIGSGAGADVLFGGSGADVIEPGAGRDVLDAGSGEDLVEARDGERDVIDCGTGTDRVRVDAADEARNCETLLP